ncbi:MAG: hypothetical protein IKW10_02115 [Oscillospiraceae bacterium]|nr:hypothetical protein [Oscillospiraceae bacterium]
MKKKSLIIIGLAAVLLAAVVLVCTMCFGDGGADGVQIALSSQSLQMDALEKTQLTAVVTEKGSQVADAKVQWSVSDETVVTVNDGTLMALKAGSAVVTASYGDAKAQCSVQVSGIVHPIVVFPKNVYEVGKGTTNQILPTLRLKNQILDNKEYDISYSFSSQDEQILTVTDKGVITGVKVGTTYVTVKATCPLATAAGIDGQLVAQVEVNVVPDYTLSIDFAEGYTEDVYLQEAEVEGTVYRAVSLLQVLEGRYEDQDIKELVTFVSSDPEVVTVNEKGEVTATPGAQRGDTAEVWAQFVTPAEGEVNSNRITFTVCKATVEKELKTPLIIDLSAGGRVDAWSVFGKNEKIEDVYDGQDSSQVSMWDPDKNMLDTQQEIVLGERDLVIVGQNISYRVDALIVSKVIRTPNDFKQIFLHNSKIDKIKADGYYVLGNNIDMSELEVVGRGWYSSEGKGLVGTFDGCGYTINGFNLTHGGGIFGMISSTGVLKNVAFTNVKVNSDGHAVVLGYAVYGTVENVYVGISQWSSTYNSKSATIGLFAQGNANNVLKNIVVVNSAKVEPGSSVINYGALSASTNKGAWENVFVVSRMRLFGGKDTAGDKGVDGSVKSVRRFNTMEGILSTDYYADRKEEFPDSIWDYSTLTFHSSRTYFVKELNELPDKVMLTLKEKEQLTQNFGAFRFKVNNSNIKRNDNEIWSDKQISSADKAWIKVSWGKYSKTVSIQTKREIQKNVTFYMNDPAQTSDLVISGLPIKQETAKVYLQKLDGTEIALTVPCLAGKITIPREEIRRLEDTLATVDYIRISAKGEDDLYVNGVKLVWVINNAQELKAMKEHLTKDGDVYSGYLALGADITDTITVTYNDCIFNDKETFAGTFDGRMHSIKRIVISSNAGNRGLFSNVSGRICNLKILDATVSNYSAPLVGMILTGELENIYVRGSVLDDGMKASTNLNNFGCSLLAGRYRDGASVKNVIVELVSLKAGLRMATAMGKLGDDIVTDAVFQNCYTVNASGKVFMNYRKAPATTAEFKNFRSNSGNQNFATMHALWEHTAARNLAEKTFKLERPLPYVELTKPFDMNVSGNDLTVTSSKLTGNLKSVKVRDTDIVLENAQLSGQTLTIPAESFQLANMPSGSLVLIVETDKTKMEILGDFIWVMHDANELMAMKDHLVADGDVFDGMLALGSDITDPITITYSGAIFNDKQTFAGTFDGRMYSIHQISLHTNAGNRGLFSNVSGRICNLKILNANVGSYHAPLVGCILTGELENIYVKGKITGDGMLTDSNINNFGASLLSARYRNGASVKNVIVEVTGMSKGLRLATAMGKFGDDIVTQKIFTNCYTVNAVGNAYMDYGKAPSTTAQRHEFAKNSSNVSFETMYLLWQNKTAMKLARDTFKLSEPEAPRPLGPAQTPAPTVTISTDIRYEMNREGQEDLVIEDPRLTGELVKVMVAKSYAQMENVKLENGKLTIPAASFQCEEMPSGEITILLQTKTEIIGVTGEFIWMINNADELMEMKTHMIPNATETVYYGHVALGADIDLSGKLLRNIGLTGIDYAGIFDGRLHRISGVVANNAGVGLLADVSGTVKNLLVVDSLVTDSTAAVVGGVLTGTAENIYVQGRLYKDGANADTAIENAGAGLLAGRIGKDAVVSNVIVDATGLGEHLRLATALGKLSRSATAELFQNCYVVGASNAAYMGYNGGWIKCDFAAAGFETMAKLWRNSKAAELASQLGLEQAAEYITATQSYDLNAKEQKDLQISGLPTHINTTEVWMLGTDGARVQIPATVQEGSLLIHKADMMAVQAQLATGDQEIWIRQDGWEYCVRGVQLIWVINTPAELMDMKSHLTVQSDGKHYDGMLALGADLDLASVTIKNNPMKDTYFMGIFDGRYHTLSNMNMASGSSRIGLFGHVEGTVRNLKILNAAVSADTAAVVGGTLFGTVENIYVQGKITADGMKETTNLKNFGAGLLAGKYDHDARVLDCIVELTEIAEGLRLGTAFGKLHRQAATETSVFENSYAVHAEGNTFMTYDLKRIGSFTEGTTCKNFDSMWLLWQDDAARTLAQKLGLTEPEKPGVPIALTESYEMNHMDAQPLVITDSRLTGQLISITVKGTEITLENGVLQNGVLTIPAASFVKTGMPSGNLVLRIHTDAEDYDISGQYIWMVNNKTQLLAMKEHLISNDGVIYDGYIALGADINDGLLFGTTNGIFTTAETFAGTFDGRFHSISSITVRGASVGLFTNVSGKICNLKVMNAVVEKNTAALVGRIMTGTMENVYVKGSITGDGMSETSNLNNFGCGLPVALYRLGAQMHNVIVDVQQMSSDLRLATAFGKLGDYKIKETIFTNCYALGAENAAYMNYKSGQTTADKLGFEADSGNGHYASYYELWHTYPESEARKLAEQVLGLEAPGKTQVQIQLINAVDMNVAGQDFVLTDSQLKGALTKVSLQGTDITLEGATLNGGVLTIPAAAFQKSNMPSGKLTLQVESDTMEATVTGEFIWVINTQDELYAMKNHLTVAADGKTYTGSLALGADIDPGSGYLSVSNSIKFFESADIFAGSFDGRNHTLYKLFIHTARNGLFPNVSGTIKNLKLENCFVNNCTGALVGQILTGTVENVYISGTLQNDGLTAGGNWTYQGCGLLACQIKTGAKIRNSIVQINEIQTNALEAGTAFGKLNVASLTESVFENCYAVNAPGVAYMKINGTGGDKLDFALSTNGNFANMTALWQNDQAASLAQSLGLEAPGRAEITVNLQTPFDMNVEGNDLVITDASIGGTVISAQVEGCDISLEGVTVEKGKMTIPAAAFQKANMPSGQLKLVIRMENVDCTVSGTFIWVINTQDELYAMKNHLTVGTDGKTYTGSLALGADINPGSGYLSVSNSIKFFESADIFAGSFDGRNHTLYKLFVHTARNGLFPNVSGTIKNLKLESCYVDNCTGALVGQILTGTVENVYISGTIQDDDLKAGGNWTYQGCGLLACQLKTGAKVKNCIVQVKEIQTDALEAGTAFGKLNVASLTESVFENCYAVNASGVAYMKINGTGGDKLNFALSTNGNFADMIALWQHEKAAALATQLGLEAPKS